MQSPIIPIGDKTATAISRPKYASKKKILLLKNYFLPNNKVIF